MHRRNCFICFATWTFIQWIGNFIYRRISHARDHLHYLEPIIRAAEGESIMTAILLDLKIRDNRVNRGDNFSHTLISLLFGFYFGWKILNYLTEMTIRWKVILWLTDLTCKQNSRKFLYLEKKLNGKRWTGLISSTSYTGEVLKD